MLVEAVDCQPQGFRLSRPAVFHRRCTVSIGGCRQKRNLSTRCDQVCEIEFFSTKGMPVDNLQTLRSDLSQQASRVAILEQEVRQLVEAILAINEELEAVHEVLTD